MTGLCTVIAGRYPPYIARVCGLCTGTPPTTVLPWPSIANRTPVTVGNCVSVYTTCAIRSGIAVGLAADSNEELRSTVAVPEEMRKPSSVVPAGICERSPAAYSAADGPASRRSSAARPTLAVAGTVRSATNNLPCRVNQVCRPISRAGPWAGGGVGRWPPGDGAVLLGPPPGGEAGLDGLAVPAGAGPSEPAGAVPQAAASRPAPMI